MANKSINSLKFGDTYIFTIPYGTCSTAAGTAAKAVTVDNFSLETVINSLLWYNSAIVSGIPIFSIIISPKHRWQLYVKNPLL